MPRRIYLSSPKFPKPFRFFSQTWAILSSSRHYPLSVRAKIPLSDRGDVVKNGLGHTLKVHSTYRKSEGKKWKEREREKRYGAGRGLTFFSKSTHIFTIHIIKQATQRVPLLTYSNKFDSKTESIFCFFLNGNEQTGERTEREQTRSCMCIQRKHRDLERVTGPFYSNLRRKRRYREGFWSLFL